MIVDNISDSKYSMGSVTVIIVGICVLIVVMVIVFIARCYYKRKKKKQEAEVAHLNLVNNDGIKQSEMTEIQNQDQDDDDNEDRGSGTSDGEFDEDAVAKAAPAASVVAKENNTKSDGNTVYKKMVDQLDHFDYEEGR